MKRQAGFTFIELLIAMAIIGILTAIAVPNYSRYITQSRMVDAQTALAGMQPLAEQYWASNREYTDMDKKGVLPANTNYFTYTLTVDKEKPSEYMVTATGQTGSPMYGFKFTIDHRGARTTAAVPMGWANPGWSTPKDCWVRDKSGTCSQ